MQMIVHLFLPFVFLLCISTQQPGVFEDMSKRRRDARYQVSRVMVMRPPRPGASKQGRVNVVCLLPEIGEGASLRVRPPSFTPCACAAAPADHIEGSPGASARKRTDRQRYQIMAPIVSTQDFGCGSMKSKVARVASSRKPEWKITPTNVLYFIEEQDS